MNPTLLEYFAAHETLSDFDEMTEEHWAKLKPTFEGMAGPFPKDMKDIPAWNATWRAKLRFIRAKAMVEEAERMKDQFQVMSQEQQRQTEEVLALMRTDPMYSIKTTNLSFSEALEAMKRGKKVKRKDWVRGISKDDVEYHLKIESILSNDWEILPEEPK